MNSLRLRTIIVVLTAVMLMASPSPCHAGILKTLAKGARSVAGKLLGESAEAGSKSATKVLSRQADDVARLAVRSSDDVAKAAVRSTDDLVAAGAKANSTVFRPGGAADDIAGFASRNKGVVVGGAALATLVTSPDAVLGAVGDTTVGIAKVAGESIAEPMIAEAGNALAPVVPQLVTNMMWVVGAAMLIGLMMCWKHQQDVGTVKKESAGSAGAVEVNAEPKPTLISRFKNRTRK